FVLSISFTLTSFLSSVFHHLHTHTHTLSVSLSLCMSALASWVSPRRLEQACIFHSSLPACFKSGIPQVQASAGNALSLSPSLSLSLNHTHTDTHRLLFSIS